MNANRQSALTPVIRSSILACVLLPAAPASAIEIRASFDAATMQCDGAPETKCDSTFLSEIISVDPLKKDSLVSISSCGIAPASLGMKGHQLFLRQPESWEGQAQVRRASFLKDGYIAYNVAVGPTWTFSGVWDKSENAILAVDTSMKSIFHVSISEGLIRQVITSSLDTEKRFEPLSVHVSPSGYIVQNASGLMWLTNSYQIESQANLRDLSDSKGYITRGIWAWVDLGGEIVTFGDRGKDPNDKTGWRAALLRFRSHGSNGYEGYEKIDDWDLTSRTRLLSQLGFPILAVAKGKAYILLVEGEPGIYEVGSGLRHLDVFPAGYDKFPDLSNGMKLDRQTGSTIYRNAEGSQMVAGLYGRGDFLYLLTRRPNAVGDETIWFLSKIDPVKEEVVHTLLLPASSPNLLLVPGEKNWAIIEKGRTEAIGNQKVQTIILVPTSVIDSGSRSQEAIRAARIPVGREKLVSR